MSNTDQEYVTEFAEDVTALGAFPDGRVPSQDETNAMYTATREAYSIWQMNKGAIMSPQDVKDFKQVMALWDTLGNIPIGMKSETIQLPFLHFPEGTPRDTVWRWFEEAVGVSVALLQRGRMLPYAEVPDGAEHDLQERVGTFIEVSTGHITYEDALTLPELYITWEHTPGFDVNCNDFDSLVELYLQGKISSQALNVLLWGYENDLTFVRFHPDGAYVADLPKFEW